MLSKKIELGLYGGEISLSFNINNVEAIKQEYDQIAEGSARTIHEIDPTTVAKVAKSDSNGVLQNFNEYRVYNQCKKYVNMSDKQIIADLKGYCDEIDDEKKVDYARNFIHNIAEVKGISEHGEVLTMEKMDDEYSKAEYEDIDHPLFRLFNSRFDLHEEDIRDGDNWMENEDGEKLIDYGCTKDIWENYTEKKEDYYFGDE